MKRFFLILLTFCCVCPLFSQSQTAAPSDLKAIDVDENSAVLTWNKENNIFKYIVSYNVAMSEDIHTLETSDTSFYISNLLSATQYLWKVRTVTNNMDTSAWSNLSSFYTKGYNTDCESVTHLKVSAFNEKDFTFGWYGNTNTSYWEVVCDEIGSNPDDIGKRYLTKNVEYVFKDLELGKTYQFAVRSHCNNSFSNWKYLYAKYTFKENLQDLPVNIDLSDENSLKSLGVVSSNTNPWVVGDVVESNGETQATALYISNDNSQSAKFNNTVKSNSYVYVDFYVPQESSGFYLDFAYKSFLQSKNDGMKVFLLSNGDDLDIDSLPTVAWQHGDSIYNNTGGQWKNVHIEFSEDYTDSPRKIVFAWTNTDTCKNNSSILLKNISITPRYCPIPSDVVVDNITYNSAEISWSLKSNQESFNIQYCKSIDTVWKTVNNVFSGYIIDDLEENTSYFIRLQANCVGQQSLYSQMYKFTTKIYLDVIDVNTIQYEVSYNKADFVWTEKDNAKFYIVNYKENTPNAQWQELNVAENSCTIEGLTPNTEYLFKVAIVTMQNAKSKYSDEVIFKTICAPITDYPYLNSDEIGYTSLNGFSNLTACYDTSQSALMTPVLNISELETAEISFDILSNADIFMYISSNAGKTYSYFKAIASNSLSTNDYKTFTYILSDYIMEDKVKIKFVFNTNGVNNIVSKIKNITIQNTCTAPKSIEVKDVNYTYITVSWNESELTTSWVVQLYDKADVLLKTMNVSSNECTFSQLQENTTYKIVIKGNCSGKESYNSLCTYVSTLNHNDGKCHQPMDFQAYWYKAKNDETILATWSVVNNEKVWEIWYKDVYAFDWNTKIVTLKPSFTLRNLKQGQVFEMKVRTICAPGDTSDFSKTDTVVVGDNSLSYIDEEENTVRIYPNPAQDILNIETQSGILSNVCIINSFGIVVKRYEKDIWQINISDLPNGNYIITGYVDERKFIKKVIKQ